MGQMINRRRYMGGKALPYDAEVEYISCNSGSIDTGIISQAYLLLETTYIAKDVNPTPQLVLFQSKDAKWNDGKSFMFFPLGTHNSSKLCLVQVGNISYSSHYRPDVVWDRDVTFKQIEGGNKFYYDGKLFVSDSKTWDTYNSNSSLIIKFSNGFFLKKITLVYKGAIVFDAIPVRVVQTGYLYDKVSKRLIGITDSSEPCVPGPDKIVEG